MKSTFKYISLIAAMLILILCSEVYAQKNDKLRGIKLSGNPDTPHKVFVVFDSTPGQSEKNLVEGLGGSIRYTYRIVPAIAATIPETAIAGLQKNPNIVAIEAVGIVTINSEEEYEWNILRIGSDIVHTTQMNKGEGVKIAIIDTGIDYNHFDLDDNYAGGKNFIEGYDPDNPYDDHSHGTHVAGIIAAEEDGSGVIGVAPDAQIFALKAFNAQGSGLDSDIVAALEWIFDYNNNPDLNGSPIRITNNSYSGSDLANDTVEQAFINLYNQGVLHVAASGNFSWPLGDEKVQYPAKFNSVIAVAATDSNNTRASFSCYGPELELSAPGESIYSTVPPNTYALKSGTSMASPHVAGVAALVIYAQLIQDPLKPVDPNEIRERLKATADDLGDSGLDDYYGWGLVDADEAADLSSLTDNLPSVSIKSPMDGDTISGDYTVVVEAVDDFGVVSVDLQIGAAGEVFPMAQTADTFWEYVWNTTPDEEGVVYEDGTYQLTATATDTNTVLQTTNSEPINITVNNSCVIQVEIFSALAIPVPGGEAAEIVFTVTDNLGSQISSTVQGEWSGLVSGGVSATTDEYGMVTFQSEKTRQSGDIIFTITDIQATGCVYDPDPNSVTTVTVTVNEEPVNEPINEKPVASFTYTCNGLTCYFDADGSSDDGGIASYLWDFGDDGSSYGITTEHKYKAAGSYDVTLTVIDDDGLSDYSTQNITVEDILLEQITISGLVDVSTSIIRNKWTAGVEITVSLVSDDTFLVSDATVTGNWSGGASGTGQCITGEDGVGTVTYTGIKGKEASATFTITGIACEGYHYKETTEMSSITVYQEP